MAMKPSRKLDKAYTRLLLEDLQTGLQLDAAKARIAELTEQLNLADRLLVAEMRAKSELTAEVTSLREALMQIANGYVIETQSVQCIARNALSRNRDGK